MDRGHPVRPRASAQSFAQTFLTKPGGKMSPIRWFVTKMPDHNTKATIHFAGDDFFVGVTPSGHAQAIETNSARASAATPMELLLIALGSCTGVDVISILKKKRQQVTGYRIEVSGDRRDEFPRSYTRMYVKHIIIGHGVSAHAVAQAIELSDTKYCSVAASLRSAEIISTYEIVEEDEKNGPA